MFYDVFEKLCRENGYTPSGACVAMGRSKNLAAKWKNTGAYSTVMRVYTHLAQKDVSKHAKEITQFFQIT